MSYYEAKEDDICIGHDRLSTVYYPPCRICGKEIKSLAYLRKIKYTCPDCKLKLKRKMEHLKKFYPYAVEDGTAKGTLEDWAVEELKAEAEYATSEQTKASGFLMQRKEGT